MKEYQKHIYEIGFTAWEDAPQNFLYSEKIYSAEEFDDICYKILIKLLTDEYFDGNDNVDVDDVYYEFLEELEKIGFESIKSDCSFYVNNDKLIKLKQPQISYTQGCNNYHYNEKTEKLKNVLNKNIRKQKLNKKLRKIK